MSKFLILAIGSFMILSAGTLSAQIKDYESTENAGMNKKERIDNVETYLANMAQSLKTMEKKLDENSSKILELDKAIKSITSNNTKKTDTKALDEKIKTPLENSGSKTDVSEIEKVRSEMMALKKQDIEKIKTNLSELEETVKGILNTLKK